EFELAVEMVLDHALVSTGHKDEMLDPGLTRFVHNVLDKRPVDHREHLFGHGLGRRQKAGSKPGDRKYGFADLCHAEDFQGHTRRDAMAAGKKARFCQETTPLTLLK